MVYGIVIVSGREKSYIFLLTADTGNVGLKFSAGETGSKGNYHSVVYFFFFLFNNFAIITTINNKIIETTWQGHRNS